MRTGHPVTVPIWQFAKVEAILEHGPYGVLGKGVASAVARGAVTAIVEDYCDFAIGGTLGCRLEGEQQSRVGCRIGDGYSGRVRLDTERQ